MALIIVRSPTVRQSVAQPLGIVLVL